jgi:hypothetical protein
VYVVVAVWQTVSIPHITANLGQLLSGLPTFVSTIWLMTDRQKVKRERAEPKKPEIRLSTPWGNACNVSQGLRGGDSESLNAFITERTRLHELYIKEQAKTKRMALILTAILILASGAIVLFAPEGRETLSYWIGAALLVFAAGAAGYGRLWAKVPGVSVRADERDSG